MSSSAAVSPNKTKQSSSSSSKAELHSATAPYRTPQRPSADGTACTATSTSPQQSAISNATNSTSAGLGAISAADATTPQARSSAAAAGFADTSGKKSSPGQNIIISESVWRGLNPADAPAGIFSPQPPTMDSSGGDGGHGAGGSVSGLQSTLCARLTQARLMRQLRAGNSPSVNRRAPKAEPVRRTVFLIRHAHAPINTEGSPIDVFDPSLSQLGLDQIHRMLDVFDDDPPSANNKLGSANGKAVVDDDDFLATSRGLPSPSVILTSPLTRALETATRTFGTMLTRDKKRAPVPIVAMEELREVVGAGVKAELRRSAVELKAMFPTVDLSLLKGDADPLAPYATLGQGEKLAVLKERAAKVLHFLMHIEHDRDNEDPPNGATIAVVSHYHLLNCLAERAICSQGRHRYIDPRTFLEVLDEAAIAQQLERAQHWQSSLRNCGIVAMDLELEDCGMRAKPRWKLWAAEFTPLSI